MRPTRSFRREDVERKWLLVDAKGRSLGRLASEVAKLLRGKHKPTFTPHDDVGDFVVVINASEVEMRGNDKLFKTVHNKHTGYYGNMKSITAAEMRARTPSKLVELAVAGMIPRGSLGNRMMKKLKIYGGAEHPHAAQKPEPVELPATTART
ncbi:MAG: 50S ribosomal protein L13 [Myxococcota bacterium]